MIICICRASNRLQILNQSTLFKYQQLGGFVLPVLHNSNLKYVNFLSSVAVLKRTDRTQWCPGYTPLTSLLVLRLQQYSMTCPLHSLAGKKYDSDHMEKDHEPREKSPVENGKASQIGKEDKPTMNDPSSGQPPTDPDKDPPKPEKMGLLKRFHHTYKEYGKILVGVHIATSTVWTCCFYYAAMSGLDVVPILQSLGLSETIIKPFTLPGVGNAAVAYLLYKLFTPLRYTVTIVGTQLTVKWMRNRGYLPPIPPKNSMRALVKEGREQAKERYDLYQGEFKDRFKDFKDDLKDRRSRQKR